LDHESGGYKLEQWYHLNELRQTQAKGFTNKQQTTTSTTEKPLFIAAPLVRERSDDGLVFEAHDDVMITNSRNSPYEFTTPELMQQNHTRRRQNMDQLLANLRSEDSRAPIPPDPYPTSEPQADSSDSAPTVVSNQDSTTQSLTTTTIKPIERKVEALTTQETITTKTAASVNNLGDPSKKKMIVKTPNWPPGICSCPNGFMFDAMLRKCLGLSLIDTHCQVDNDCRQIRLTHCSMETKKCECDEPFVWNQTELMCQRPKKILSTETTVLEATATSGGPNDYRFTPVTQRTKETPPNKQDNGLESLIPPLLLAKLLPDQTVMLLILVIVVITATLIILGFIVKCFSSNSAALISPKSPKNKGHKATSSTDLPPRSPYATLKRPEYHNKHSQFTQAARGRILNYDFEQDSPTANNPSDSAHSPHTKKTLNSSATLHRGGHQKNDFRTTTTIESQTGGGTLSRLKMHKHSDIPSVATKSGPENEMFTARPNSKSPGDTRGHSTKKTVPGRVISAQLDESIDVEHLESGSERSETGSQKGISGPPPLSNQPPPYMLASSSMKGQGSAIAAAAAAVANRRMQLAQKKAATGDQQQSNKFSESNGSPVFL